MKELNETDNKQLNWIKKEVITGFVKETLQDQIVSYQLKQDDFKYKQISSDNIIQEKLSEKSIEQSENAPSASEELQKGMNIILAMKIDKSEEYHSTTFVIDLPKKLMFNIFTYKIRAHKVHNDLQEISTLDPEDYLVHSDCPLKISISTYDYFQMKPEDKQDH